MDDKENLFYKPDLQPDRDYRSDGTILSQPFVEIEIPTETPVPDKITQLIEDILEIKEIAQFLPGNLPTLIDGPLKPLLDELNIKYPNGKSDGLLDIDLIETYDPGVEEPIAEIPYVLEAIEDYTYADAALPSILPQSTDIKIKVTAPKSLAAVASDTYNHDSVDLKNDYVKKLQTVMQKYLQEMIMIMSETGLSDIEELTKEYDGAAVTISNANLKHLGDYIVRSQIAREQKTRLFRKTHNIDQTMMHMRSWHAAEKQRERYYAETYGDSETYLNTQNNSLLRESRALYDKKYNQTLYDMYKYLNASVMIIDDTLKMSLKESQAKGMLLKNGVNIYATAETVAVAKKTVSTGTGTTSTIGNASKPSNTTSNSTGAIADTSGTAAKTAATNITTVVNDSVEAQLKALHKEFYDYAMSVKADVLRKGAMLVELWNYMQTGSLSTLVAKTTPEEVKSAVNYNILASKWETASKVSKEVMANMNSYSADTYLYDLETIKISPTAGMQTAKNEYEIHKTRISTVLGYWSAIRTQAVSIFETFD